MGTRSGFGSWWKRLWRRGRRAEYLPVTPDSGLENAESLGAPEKPSRRLQWPVSRRDRQLAALQAGYTEMLGLMRSIREHLEHQQVVQQKMVQVLDRLPDTMEGLKDVGRAVEQQVEVLSLLRQQFEAADLHDRELADSMNRFNRTLAVMDETSRNSGRAVTQLIEKAAASEKMLHSAMERSERRFMVVTGLFTLLAVVVAGSVLWSVWKGPLAAGLSAGSPPASPGPTLMPTAETVDRLQAPMRPDLLDALQTEAAQLSPPPEAVIEPPPPEPATPPEQETSRQRKGKLFKSRRMSTPEGEAAPPAAETGQP